WPSLIYAIAADSQGDVFFTGTTTSGDVYVAELNRTWFVLIGLTILGGSGADRGRGIALDPQGNVYLTGDTNSADFPTRNAFQSGLSTDTGSYPVDRNFDAFMIKLDWRLENL